ncbi:MAG TPA: aromatic acid exporter family protein, partial [Negativicutes bacterium]|nr:aromatic acid exporter family protein [Negativicutes bacterium]
MKVGARILKTGIAVTITMFICSLLKFEPAFFGAVSAVINMQPSIFLSIKTAKEQILVHILGVGAGLAMGYLLGGNPLSMGLITILIISVYIKLNLQEGITMGIVAAVFVLGSGSEQFLPHALSRTAVIFTGLSVAMLVNVFLWPPRHRERFKEKLKDSNLATVRYFCRAVQEFVRLENGDPDLQLPQREMVHALNEQTRELAEMLRREGELLTSGTTGQGEWLTGAERFLAYNESLARKADRIYDILPSRLDRRLRSGAPPFSDEFKAILVILERGCLTVTRINGKLRSVILEGLSAAPEAIREDYWEELTKAIEQWQPKLTGSFYLHALMEVSVTANEIKWASREAKKLLT